MPTSKSDRLIPNHDLFKNMEQHKNYTKLAIKPEAGSDFDLVCCGPKKLVEINRGVIIGLVKFGTNTMKYLLLWVIDMQHAARLPS